MSHLLVILYIYRVKNIKLSVANKKLIKRLKENDASAWREIVKLYSDNLFAYALSLSSDHDIASEIVQQVFVNAFEARNKINPDYSLKSYLYKSTYNKFIDLYRKKKSMSILHEQYYFMLNQFITNEKDKDLTDKLKLMNLMIDSLPVKTKEVFTLSKKRGLSNIEISELLNISIKTVEGHITKAFKLLRKELKSSKY